MKSNSTYHVTPPSLLLVGDGLSIFLIGFDKERIDNIEKMFEKNVYDADLVFFYSEQNIDGDTIAWADAVAKKSEYIIINLDNVNPLELEIGYTNTFDIIDENDREKVINYTEKGFENPIALYKENNGDNSVIHGMDGLAQLIDILFENGD